MQLPLHPKETVINFVKSVAEEVEAHPDPDSDEELREKRRLARQIQAATKRQQAELNRQMEQAQRARQKQLEFGPARTKHRTL